MKKTISILLIICMILALIPDSVRAVEGTETTTESTWEYETYGEGVVLTNYNGTETDVYVPSTIEEGNTEYQVVKLGDDLFNNNDSLNSVTLGSGITEIGARTFYDADNLVCIVTNEELTTIGDETFYSCDNFNSVILYDAVTTIGVNVFAECGKLVIWCNENSAGHLYAEENGITYELLSEENELITYTIDGVSYHIQNGQAYAYDCDTTVTEVTIPASVEGYPVTEIYTEAFKDCTYLLNIYLPDSVKTIKDSAFYNCTCLQNIELPAGVSTLGKGVFYDCASLESIVIPDKVTAIDEQTFYGCTSLNNIVLSKNTESIGANAFYGCSLLEEVILPQGVTTIENYAFSWCSNLKKIELPYGISAIEYAVFSQCESLQSVTIPSSVTSIGSSAFAGCAALTELTIPERVLTIGSFAFSDCVQLNNIQLPTSITTLQAGLFKGCSSLSEFTISSGVQTLEYSVFENCTSLETMIIPDNVQTCDISIFAGCTSLSKITLSSNMKYISSKMFQNCTALKKITIPNNIGSIHTEAFSGCTGLEEVIVEKATITKYAFKGCANIQKVSLAEGVDVVGTNAFVDCINLKSVVLPESIVLMGENAFYYKTLLLAYEESYAQQFAQDNDLFYQSYDGTEEPEFYKQDGITYCIMNGEAIAFDSDTDITEAVIPETVKEASVIGLWRTFENRTNLISVSLPESLKYISRNTFYNCTSLTGISIPNEITSIEPYTFYNCTSLTEVTMSENLDSIGEYAFYSCPFTEVELLQGITSIGDWAFAYCYHLENIVLPNGLLSIGTSAFSGTTALKSVIIPDTVTSIAGNPFATTTILFVYEDSYAHSYATSKSYTYFVISEGQTPELHIVDGISYCVVGEEAFAVDCDSTLTEATVLSEVNGTPVVTLKKTFYECRNLKKIYLPEGIRTIDSYTFAGCIALQEVNIPDGVVALGTYAFSNCSSLSSVVLPEGLVGIEKGAFNGCSSLTSVSLPSSLTYIGENAFYNCQKLVGVIIPEGITEISKYAFYSCKKLSINLPNTLKVIGERAFMYCTYMSEITIPDGVTTIGREAFYGCNGLTTLVIPGSVEELGYCQFQYCAKLQEVTFQKGVKTLGMNAFYGCANLTTLNFPSTLESIGGSTFQACSALINVTLPEGLKTIGSSAFYGCSNLYSVIIPNSVETIGYQAFYDCHSLYQVNIPSGVVTIDGRAFYNCTYLTKVTIADTVTTIIYDAFRNCTRLQEVILPSGLTKLGTNAFDNCTSLTKVVLPNTLTVIESSTFAGCTSLTEIEIPAGVTTIYSSAFNNCSALENVILNEGLQTIASTAFSSCAGLKSVLVPESVSSLTTTSFASNTILIVYEDSYAHTFAKENDLLYFVIRKTNNPEIAYGTGIDGSVSYTDGTAASGVSVELLYDDGFVKESISTDESGLYGFTYAEVGRYTIQVADSLGNTASGQVSVKRMNVFEVFLQGDTDFVLKKSWSISGTVSEEEAIVTLLDQQGNVLQTLDTTDGTFVLEDVANGTYIVRAETENGSTSQEVTVFDSDVTDVVLNIDTDVVTIWGYVEVEDRECKHHRRNWVEVTIYDTEGIVLGHCKSDADGKYEFVNLPIGEYTIVAQTTEMRPDKKHHYDRSHVLTGYAYMDIVEAGTYQADTIVLYEESDSAVTLSGKVTAHGEPQNCEVTLRNVFGHEVASCTTGKNGKYNFKNVLDGMYFVTAITESKGMGYTVVVVRDGKVYGNTDITVYKSDKIKDREDKFKNEIPECNSREDVLAHRERIAEEKRFYDELSHKEKRQCSKEYVERLNCYSEWLANCEYTVDEGVQVQQGGLVISGDELENENELSFHLTVEKKDAWEISTDGVNTEQDYIYHCMDDAAKDCEIVQYYEISMCKTKDGNEKTITSVYKDTDAMGKFRVTIELPEEYRGYKHYSFVHVHCGEVMTLVDLDDDPNTVTFEVDKFSTFALAATNQALGIDFLLGDLNEDGELGKSDSDLMRKILATSYEDDSLVKDINEDDILDSRDLVALKLLKSEK